MKISLQQLRKIGVMLFFSVLSFLSYAQNQISGIVTNSKDGLPLSGVTISIKGTKTAVQSDANGAYNILVPSNKAVLLFTSVGYDSQQIGATSSTLNVQLLQNNAQMQEVVVVAYGTKKKSDLTGAVTSVSAKDFQKGSINSSEQLLQGKVAGLQITSGGGSAGGGSRIRIRGASSLNSSNDPLVVIDGIPIENNSIGGGGNILNSINPNDIESISVLKDASATALYGSRATNGVLIITTKKGSKGKIKFNYNTNFSVGKIVKKVDVFTGDEIRSIVNADATKTGSNGYKSLLGNANSDWQDLIYQTAKGYDNNLSASGTILKNKLPFRISAGYLTQDGILRTDNFKRATVGLNLSPKLLDDHLTLNFNFKYANTKYRHADDGAIGAAATFDPTQAPTQNNKFGGNFEWLSGGGPIGTNGNASNPNPLSLLNFRNNNEKINRVLTNLQLDYKFHFLPDLHLLANLGYDGTNQNGNDNTDSILVTAFTSKGRYQQYKQEKKNTIAEVSLSYSKEIKSIKTKFDVLVGHGYQAFETDIFNYRSYNQKGDTIAKTFKPEFATDKQENRLESYFGRINFNINDKYLVTGSLRRDASSRFSKDNRVGYFPSIAVAWKLKEEFFKTTSAVSELKLRIGYGITGQQDGIGNYGYLARYSLSSATAQYQFGNTFYNFYRPSPYYPKLKWETTTARNVGVDFGFLNNRISGSVEFYNKETKDLLSIVDQAPGQNFDISLLRNIGSLENNGVEFTLNTTPLQKKDFRWDLGFNVTFQNSKITKLNAINDPSFPGIDILGISGGTGNNIAKHQVGYTAYTYYLRQQVYDATSGKPIEGLYEDINRNGATDDQYLNSKSATPTMLFGLNTQFNYKKMFMGVAGHGSYNNYLYDNFASRTGVLNGIQNGSVITNGSRDYLNTGFKNQQYLSDYYIQNASFFRLDNINVGYDFGKVYRNKAALRLSASVQNVFVITKYKGLDPENSGNGNDNIIYPRPRIYSLTANLDF